MDDNEIHDVGDHLEFESEPSPIPWGAGLLVIWAAALIIFAIQNAENTTVEFFWIDLTMPVAVLVIGTAAATALLTGLAWSFYTRRRRKHQAAKGG
ncbi:MAG TPA: LapA family protein [Acidimicrobiia bacterium]|jgi:uncharacterized integral membrane protein